MVRQDVISPQSGHTMGIAVEFYDEKTFRDRGSGFVSNCG